jgi:hypothetical protein
VNDKTENLSVLFVKVQRWLRLWRKASIKEFFSPITDAAAALQILLVMFTIYLVYLGSGNQAAKAEVLSIWAAQKTLFAIIPVFAVICMIRAGFLVTKKIGELGQWHINTFVYNKPQQVFTITVSSADNNKTHFFELSDAQSDCLVKLGFDIDRRDGRVKAQITDNGHPHIDWRGATPLIRTGFRLPKNRKLGLLTLADAEVDPTTIRVYAYSWEIFPTI